MGDDIATEAAGASVIMATCGDERHPPENIIEPKDGSFWVTTGLYPQEFVIKLGSTAQVNKVRTLTSNGTCVRVVCVVWERAVTGQGAREGERGGVCTRQRCDFTCVSVSRLHPLSPPRALLRPPLGPVLQRLDGLLPPLRPRGARRAARDQARVLRGRGGGARGSGYAGGTPLEQVNGSEARQRLRVTPCRLVDVPK